MKRLICFFKGHDWDFLGLLHNRNAGIHKCYRCGHLMVTYINTTTVTS